MGPFIVHARKWQDGWELRIVGAGVTWSPDLAQACPRARAFIGDPEARVEVIPTVDDETDRLILDARGAVDGADAARRSAAGAVRGAMRRLAEAGVAEDDAARLLGVPLPRLHALAAEGAPAPAQRPPSGPETSEPSGAEPSA
ncbi:hypothetical protein [Nocardiopsis composta]|uniref:Uncharacterized protein n=1 Tax=Nocardiopsis composta TaxID=157465 RepID=A0A7W8QSA8_9ACTN|nr:hypothetical protein [Nocardiopsis composta]MBB5435556.1 hypothetical protein [Nocardiopsis composta]